NGTGFQNGDWNGAGGIMSSTASPSNGNDMVQFSLGYADNSALELVGSDPYTSFGGQPADSTSILVRYTYGADGNLDGVIDDKDVTIVASNWNQPKTGQWFFGHLDYD